MKHYFLTISLIASNSFSYAGFQSIDDADLGAISGQAGITIESDLYLTIGSLDYKDEGSIVINQIEVGGANKATYFGKDWGESSHSGSKLDGSLITIDVLDDGDLVISGAVNPKLGGGVIDFGIAIGEIQLRSADTLHTSTVIKSINLSGIATKFRAKIDAQTNHILTEAQIGIDDLDLDISGLNIKVENAFIAAPSYFESLNEWGEQGLALQDTTVIIKTDMYADDAGLKIDTQQLEFDMGIESLSIGAASIGSFNLNDVALSQSSSLIYGHP
jgi:hypothetical protein